MTTLGNMVTEVQRRALSDLREEVCYLGNAITDTTTTTFSLATGQTLGSIQSGSYVEIDYEYMRVMSATAPSGPISVIRGYSDSTPTPHNANSVITVNPRFPAVDIIKAINEDIDDLSSPANGLFQMNEVTLTFIPVVQGYDMLGVTAADVLEVWEVRAHEYGPSNKYEVVNGWRVERNADTSVFPSGISLKINEGGFPGRPLRVQYKAPYSTPLINGTDDVLAVTGLHSQAHDIPVLGAPARLMQFRELKRSFSEAQGEPRRAQEVPVGASLTASKGLMMMRDARISAERARLQKMFPKVRN